MFQISKLLFHVLRAGYMRVCYILREPHLRKQSLTEKTCHSGRFWNKENPYSVSE